MQTHIFRTFPLTLMMASLLVAAPALGQPPGYDPYEAGPDDYYEGEPHGHPPQGDPALYEDDGSLRVVEQGSPEAQAVTAEQGRGFEAGGHLLIPFYVGRGDLLPGIGIQARLGWEFPKGLTIEANVGIQANRFNDPFFDDFLTAFWIGGGVRYSFLNPTPFVPFIGANLQVSFWAMCLDAPGGICTERSFTAGLGVSPLAGVAWEIGSRIALELGLQATLTFFSPDSDLVFYNRARTTEAYISPFLGGTMYF
jgi:hypothetical protein